MKLKYLEIHFDILLYDIHQIKHESALQSLQRCLLLKVINEPVGRFLHIDDDFNINSSKHSDLCFLNILHHNSIPESNLAWPTNLSLLMEILNLVQ